MSLAAKSFWPPCVRVTVVRSPVLQVGTLFIITADSSATFGRFVFYVLRHPYWDFTSKQLRSWNILNPLNHNLSVSHREKDMDHAVRIPEMGVSKVPSLVVLCHSFMSCMTCLLDTELPSVFVPVPCRGLL